MLSNITYFCNYRLQKVEDAIQQEKQLDIFQDPIKTFNSDKSSCHFFPKNGEDLVCKGNKNVYEVDRHLAKVTITALFILCLCFWNDVPTHSDISKQKNAI